jgi:dynactin complex subunit
MGVFFMGEEDLKLVLAKYQQKLFELFNQNIVLETQIEKLNANISNLSRELEKLKKPKRGTKGEEDFT